VDNGRKLLDGIAGMLSSAMLSDGCSGGFDMGGGGGAAASEVKKSGKGAVLSVIKGKS